LSSTAASASVSLCTTMTMAIIMTIPMDRNPSLTLRCR
jgi:hypothetical protein